MERNIMGELDMYRQAGTKPNFTDIARRYGLHRHTVAKYWNSGGQIEDGRHERASGFDQLRGVIEQKAMLPGVTKKGIHEFLLDRYPELELPGYTALTHYMRENGIACGMARDPEAHPRYETAPGEQLQFDWKENVRMHDVDGVLYEFNVFSATLGYSRLHRYRYSETRTEEDLLRCLLSVIVANGGTTRAALTDNMSALVSMSSGVRRKSRRAWAFAAEAGFELELCAPGTPETKGKDESANRFLSRLRAYDGDFQGLDGLLAAIARIEARSNSEPNGTTGVPPAVLFMREKEHLRPVGNLRNLEEMIGDVSVQVVPPTMLVRCAGREWSVPRKCIGRKVKVVAASAGRITVSMDGELVASHDASAAGGPIVYDPGHYAQALAGKRRYADADIYEAAVANLEMLDGLGEAGAS